MTRIRALSLLLDGSSLSMTARETSSSPSRLGNVFGVKSAVNCSASANVSWTGVTIDRRKTRGRHQDFCYGHGVKGKAAPRKKQSRSPGTRRRRPVPPRPEQVTDRKGRPMQPCPAGSHGDPPRPCFGFVEEPERNGVSVTVHYVNDPDGLDRLLSLLLDILDDHHVAGSGTSRA